MTLPDSWGLRMGLVEQVKDLFESLTEREREVLETRFGIARGPLSGPGRYAFNCGSGSIANFDVESTPNRLFPYWASRKIDGK